MKYFWAGLIWSWGYAIKCCHGLNHMLLIDRRGFSMKRCYLAKWRWALEYHGARSLNRCSLRDVPQWAWECRSWASSKDTFLCRWYISHMTATIQIKQRKLVKYWQTALTMLRNSFWEIGWNLTSHPPLAIFVLHRPSRMPTLRKQGAKTVRIAKHIPGKQEWNYENIATKIIPPLTVWK